MDVTEEAGLESAGYCFGAAVGDYDNDGDVDIYVTKFGPNQLFQNLGNGRFRDVTGEAGVKGGKWSTSAAFLDYDNDGFLDLYVCRYLEGKFLRVPSAATRAPGGEAIVSLISFLRYLIFFIVIIATVPSRMCRVTPA